MNVLSRYVGLVLAVWMASPILAQEDVAPIQIEHFEPMPDQANNILNVGTSSVLPHLGVTAGAIFEYVQTPLRLVFTDAQGNVVGEENTVDSQIKTEVLAAMSFFDIFDVGIALPIIFSQTGGSLDVLGASGLSAEGFALGDLRFVPRVRLPMERSELAGFGFALALPVYLPTGDTNSFNGEGFLRFEPRLIIDWEHYFDGVGPLAISANVGYQLREKKEIFNLVNDDQLRWAVGATAPLGVEGLTLLGSIFGSVGLTENINPLTGEAESDGRTSPLEALGAVRYNMPFDMTATVGGGAGIGEGVGAPEWRVFVSLGYAPLARDSDEDGIVDNDDECPEIPEDIDQWQDEDGCPDEDNDEDGIADVSDACPNNPEDPDSFEDEDGCPDPDNDEDGILDVDDACPMIAEDMDGFEDEDGCIDDNDGDGIADVDDACPEIPEDMDGFEDEDGCRDDNDGDGIADWDGTDQCPDVPEDMDGFEDEDGCIDDNDKDGIADVDDQCPNEAETINGYLDEDGCPDKGKPKVIITEKSIDILDKVYFDTSKTSIKKVSYDILDQVALVLKANPQLTSVRIEGHTDSRGSDSNNQELSDGRAASVVDYLVDKGIDRSRLVSMGYGEDCPIASNKKKNGREKNRRVEFHILEVSGVAVEGAIAERDTFCAENKEKYPDKK